jgi:hypothetical protein
MLDERATRAYESESQASKPKVWRLGSLGSTFVVISTGGYADLVVGDPVDEAVLVCDAS